MNFLSLSYAKKIEGILDFWFEYCGPKDWFKKDKYFDKQIKNQFIDLIKDALHGYNNDWKKSLKNLEMKF